MQIHLDEVAFSYIDEKIKQNLSFVSTLYKLKLCFTLLNCANLSLSKLIILFTFRYWTKAIIVNSGKDRENLSLLTDYDVVPLLTDVMWTRKIVVDE